MNLENQSVFLSIKIQLVHKNTLYRRWWQGRWLEPCSSREAVGNRFVGGGETQERVMQLFCLHCRIMYMYVTICNEMKCSSKRSVSLGLGAARSNRKEQLLLKGQGVC